MNDRDVGGMGEAEFKKWCDSVGLAANKFHEDKTGKDFLVEFPLDANAKHIHEAPITARVQIKSTDKKRRKEQITFINLFVSETITSRRWLAIQSLRTIAVIRLVIRFCHPNVKNRITDVVIPRVLAALGSLTLRRS